MKNKLKFEYFFPVLLFFIFLTSCTKNNSIDKKTLAKAYVDILVVEEYYKNIDSVKTEKAKVFEKYSITKENYNSTLESFSSDQKSWDEFFKLANIYLDTLKANVKNTKEIKQLGE